MKNLQTILLSLILFFVFTLQSNAQSTKSRDTTTPYPGKVKELRTDKPFKITDPTPAKALGPIHYYQNTDGNTIQAPTKYNKVPDGATAICRDGTYSFSQHRSGTCSHHGGVAKWLEN